MSEGHSPSRRRLTAALHELYNECGRPPLRVLAERSDGAMSRGTIGNLLNAASKNPPTATRVRQFVLACRAHAARSGRAVPADRFFDSRWQQLVEATKGCGPAAIGNRGTAVLAGLSLELNALVESANAVPMPPPRALSARLTASLEEHNTRARLGRSAVLEPAVLDQLLALARKLRRFEVDAPPLRAALARTHLGQGDFVNANEHAEAAVAASATASSEHVLLRGETRLNLGELTRAAEDFEAVIASLGEACVEPGMVVPDSSEQRAAQRCTAMQFARMWIPDLQGKHLDAAAAGSAIVRDAAEFGSLAQSGPLHRQGRALVAANHADLTIRGLRLLQISTRLAGDAGNPHLKLWEYRALAALGWGAADTTWASFMEAVTGFDDGMRAHLLFEQGKRVELRSAAEALTSYEQAIDIWSKAGYVNAGSRALAHAAVARASLETTGSSQEPVVLMAGGVPLRPAARVALDTISPATARGHGLGARADSRSLARPDGHGSLEVAESHPGRGHLTTTGRQDLGSRWDGPRLDRLLMPTADGRRPSPPGSPPTSCCRACAMALRLFARRSGPGGSGPVLTCGSRCRCRLGARRG